MMKRVGSYLLAAMLIISVLTHPTTSAAARGDNHVTQGELALLLVNVLGLHRYLPAAPSEHAAMELLMVNGIAPAHGWMQDAVVTRADLARIIVLALDRGDEVEDPDDPQSWMDFLIGIGVPIDTVGVALENVGPLGEVVAPHLLVASTTTDPLKRQTIFGQPDEMAFGTDMTHIPSMHRFIMTMRDIIEVITVVERPPRRIPVTPD